MSRSSVILRNVASNWAGFAVNAAVTLVLTPFVLHQLGPSRYGIWVLTASIIGYYGLLDIGFRSGVTQYLTRDLAAGEIARASACLSSAIAVLGALGAAMVGLSIGAAYAAPHLFRLPAGLEREAFWCILIVGCSSGVQFALQPFTSVFTATQRLDLANGIGVATRLLTALGIALTLGAGLGLVGVSAATCAASLVDYAIRWRVAMRLAPGLEVARRHASWARVREIGTFGAWNTLISLNSFVYAHVPNMLIGFTLPVAAVGHYALATGLTRQLRSILSPVPQVVYPAAAELHVQGDARRLERLYHDGSRLMLLVLAAVVVPAAFWSADFYRLWIGESYLSGVPFPSVAVLFQILLVSVVADHSSSVAGQILVGAGRVRTMAMAMLAGSAINVTMSVILLPYFSLAGLAMATVCAAIAIDVIAVPLLLQRSVGLSATTLLRRACLRPLAVAVLLSAVLAAMRLAVRPADWAALAAVGCATAAVSAALVLAVGVTAEERQRLLLGPLERRWQAATS